MPTASLQTSTANSTKIEWVTKEEAARLLDKSERTVLAMAADGRIKSKRDETPDSRGQKVTLLHAGDVARLADGRDASTAVQVSKRASVQSVAIAPWTASAPISRPWLTLDEAAEFSGLTKRWLLDAAARNLPLEQSVMLAVRDMGKRARGGRWRFLRSDLERA